MKFWGTLSHLYLLKFFKCIHSLIANVLLTSWVNLSLIALSVWLEILTYQYRQFLYHAAVRNVKLLRGDDSFLIQRDVLVLPQLQVSLSTLWSSRQTARFETGSLCSCSWVSCSRLQLSPACSSSPEWPAPSPWSALWRSLQCLEFALGTTGWSGWWAVGSRICSRTRAALKRLGRCWSAADVCSKRGTWKSSEARGSPRNKRIALCKFCRLCRL